MASRFNQRDANRSSLFSSYDAQQSSRSRPSSAAPPPPPGAASTYRSSTPTNTYRTSSPASHGPAFSAYPVPSSSSSSSSPYDTHKPRHTSSTNGTVSGGGSLLPQYKSSSSSSSVLDSLESQNDAAVGEMSKRVAMLKDITLRIGDEIRDSTALAEKMNDNFGAAGLRLKGTMNRMLRMAERTGVGWRVWLGFFAAVIVLFWYVWLF